MSRASLPSPSKLGSGTPLVSKRASAMSVGAAASAPTWPVSTTLPSGCVVIPSAVS